MNDGGIPQEQFGPARLGPTAPSAPLIESAEPPVVLPYISAEPRRSPRRGMAAVAGVVGLAVAGMVLGTAGGIVGRDDNAAAARPAAPVTAGPSGVAITDPSQSDGMVDASNPLYRDPDSVAGIASQVLESTVYIEAISATGTSSGTGVVYRADGIVVTNNHVIVNGAGTGGRITVTFADGTVSEAKILGRTEDYDLAVLEVDLDGLTPLAFADSDHVVVGDPVIAVGAPLGLEGTVTTGIVSALNRAVTAGSATEVSYINAIQTDAAINPGNSGGPLVDMQGRLIGINSAIAQPPGTRQATGSIGLGFAIPSNQVVRTAEQLIETGRATYPIIGILLDGTYTGQGVLVSTAPTSNGTAPVTPGGPGEAAGVEPGDVILRVDGRPVTSPDEVIVTVRSRAPGDTLTLTIERDGGEFDVDVVLGEQEAK